MKQINKGRLFALVVLTALLASSLFAHFKGGGEKKLNHSTPTLSAFRRYE